MLWLALLDPSTQPIRIAVTEISPSMSEVTKTLVAASVGALLGILSSLLMEFAKPHISDWIVRTNVKRHLEGKFIDNWAVVKAAERIADGAHDEVEYEVRFAFAFSVDLLVGVSSEKLDAYLASTQRSLLYDIEAISWLRAFYRWTASAVGRPMSSANHLENLYELRKSLSMAILSGESYISKNSLSISPTSLYEEDQYIKQTERYAELIRQDS